MTSPKSLTIIFIVAFLGGFFVFSVLTTAPTLSQVQLPARTTIAPPSVSAEAWGIFDVQTGEIIAGKDIIAQYPIASLTKLFTAYSVLTSSHRDDEFTIVAEDVIVEGRAGKLFTGDIVTPYSLLFPLLLESSNDAGEAIRRYLNGEFEKTIAQTKNTLSLTKTDIVDASGLSPLNRSSVVDLAHFYTYIKNVQPHLLDITQLSTYIGENSGYMNNNPAQKLAYFNGGKHGYTDEAGRTFVGSFLFPNNEEIGVVLLKSNDIATDLSALIGYGESLENISDIMAK